MDELTLNTLVPKMTKPTYDKVSPLRTIKKKTETKSPAVSLPQLKKKVDLSAEQLLLTLMDEVKSLKEQIKVPSNNSPSVSQTGILSLPKGNKPPGLEHLEQFAINKTLIKLKAQSSMNPSAKKAPMKSKPFKELWLINHCPKKHPNSRKPSIANRRSTEPTKKAAFVNGLKHNLISINQLCDANYKVLFTKTKGTIFNQNDEVVLISPRRRDVYVIDIEYDEAISQSSTEGDAINFNENRSFLDDEFLEPRSKVTQCSGYIEYFSYIPAYENITPTHSLILQDSVSPKEPHVFTSADDHPALTDHVHTESTDNLEPAKI
ncbi:hypothetical protein Tco_0091806 [Tanacetum coccineum]